MSAQVGAIELVVEAVKRGDLSQEAIDISVERVKKIKNKYLSASRSIVPDYAIETIDAKKDAQATLASQIYAQSTTLVRSEPGVLPISKNPATKVVFLSPGKEHPIGGVVASGEEKTREPYTPAQYIDLLKTQNPSTADIRFYDSVPLSPEMEKSIEAADAVIFATRNASLSSYQKEKGLSLGRKLGNKLIVIATCDPYDFLEEVGEIKNYITIYEPTIPAFKSAVDVLFGVTQAAGKLPVGSQPPKHEIRLFDGSDEEIVHVWQLWEEILPAWRVTRDRLADIIKSSGKLYMHDQGFCLAYSTKPGVGAISCVAVRESYQGRGIGTALITRARRDMREAALSAGLYGMHSLGIHSVFPRFWPGVPTTFPSQTKDFFLHRGMQSTPFVNLSVNHVTNHRRFPQIHRTTGARSFPKYQNRRCASRGCRTRCEASSNILTLVTRTLRRMHDQTNRQLQQ